MAETETTLFRAVSESSGNIKASRLINVHLNIENKGKEKGKEIIFLLRMDCLVPAHMHACMQQN